MRERSRAWMRGRNGRTANAWKGEKAGYHAVHLWLTKHFIKSNACEICGTTNYSRLEWANISGKYKRERSDYKVLCPKCHRLLDLGGKCRRGHIYKPETTLINNRGHRYCLICKLQREENNANNKV
jgi:hypothetical protein